ncbi:hypothetical protein [Falsarthrobacter nasiphocae]|uniref:Uncharacterized protein n=1 Tax=Falsarthrobacter nasiphocae TaxID=189863 RepID=A0AAE3YFH4_9MICC|nr:hypothetical protein [Falsarthrobacter nasiphocae]MDR6891199.1 hypothetical protein [Falsarthrobacter nasiphocae]
MNWEERYVRFGRVFGEAPTPFLDELIRDGTGGGQLRACAGAGRPDLGAGAPVLRQPAITLAESAEPFAPPRALVPGDGYGRNGLALAAAALRPGGTVVVVTSPEVASPRAEQSLWPGSITWEDRSTEAETRLIGRA